MAVTAKFQADFTTFSDAVQKADVQLKTFEANAGKVQTSLTKMANSLSGTAIVQQATIAAAAVEKIGGVSKLTESELARLSAQAKEAVAKLTALGQTVPAGIQKIADATKDATKQTMDWKNALASTAGAFGVAFSVGAVVAFGKSVFDSASKIGDLASQLGISTDAIQGFQFAAEQSGSSLDAVGTAITKMNANLAGGDKATVKALKDAGLGFDAIRSMKPEDAFLAITDAIQQIPDPMIQTDVALQLFGKSAAELLPAIKDGFRGVSDSASKMSAETIRSLKAAQDAWSELGRNVTIVSGTLIASMMDLGKAVTSSGTSVAKFARDVVLFGAGPAANMAVAFDKSTQAAKDSKDIILKLPGPLKQTAEQLAAAAAAAAKFQAAFDKWSGATATRDLQTLDAVFRKLAASGKLTEDQVNAIVKEALKLQAEGGKLTERLTEMAVVTNAWSPGLSQIELNLKNVGTQIDLDIPKLDAFGEALKKIRDLPKGNPMGLFGDVDITKVGTGAKDLIRDAEAYQKKLEENRRAVGELGRALIQLGQSASGSFGLLTSSAGQLITSMLRLRDMTAEYSKIANKTFSDNAAYAASAAAGIIPIFSTLVSVFDQWGAAEERQRKIASASMREQFNSALALAGSLSELKKRVDALGLSWATLSQTMTRIRPENVAAIGIAIDRAGTSIEDFNKKWAETPQGMAEAAYKTIAQLQAEADKAKAVYDYMLKSGLYTAGELARAFQASAAAQVAALGDSAKAQQDELDAIAAKYKETIDKLDSEMKSLSDSIAKEAPEEFMGIVEAQERARLADLENQKRAQEAMRDAEIAAKKSTFEAMFEEGQKVDAKLRELFGKTLQIPYEFVPKGTPSGTGTYTPPAGGSGGGGGASGLRVVVNIDGRAAAEALVPHIPGVVNSYGLTR